MMHDGHMSKGSMMMNETVGMINNEQHDDKSRSSSVIKVQHV